MLKFMYFKRESIDNFIKTLTYKFNLTFDNNQCSTLNLRFSFIKFIESHFNSFRNNSYNNNNR